MLVLNLCVIIIVSISLRQSYIQFTENGIETVESYSSVLESNISIVIRSIDLTLLNVSDQIERWKASGGISPQEITQYLSTLDARLPETVGLRIVDAKGNVTYAANGVTSMSENISDRDHFKALRDNKNFGLYITSLIGGKITGKYIIVFARRINNTDGSFAGEVVIAMETQKIGSILSSVKVGKNGVVSLWNSNLNNIARFPSISNPEDLVAHPPQPSPQLRSILAQDEKEVFYQAHSGTDSLLRYYYLRKVGEYPLYVIVGLADDDLMSSWRKELLQMSLMTGLFLLLTYGIWKMLLRGWHQYDAQVAKENLQRLQVTFQSIGDAVITTTASGVVDFLNPMAERLTGWPLSEAMNRPLSDIFKIVNENDDDVVINPMDPCMNDDQVAGSIDHKTLISRDGARYDIGDSSAPIRDDKGVVLGVVLIFHDMTEQRRLAKEMNHRATHDALTGIFNRGEFELRLQRAVSLAHESNAVHGFLYIDLDRFKVINDTCGHAAGDQLLLQVVGIIQSCIRKNDTLGRLGGDEFGVILDCCNQDQTVRIAQEIRRRVDGFRFVYGDQQFQIGVSIGLISFDRQWQSIVAIMQAADAACYEAKNAGRNQVYLPSNIANTINF